MLIAALFCGCAHQQPQLCVSQYHFKMDNDSYRIRSISSMTKTESCNELIGEKFMAVDYDQDGVLDCIILGEASLSQVQNIYDYGLNGVSKENKLRVQHPSINRFASQGDNHLFEIRSFQPFNTAPFNEFKITLTRALVHPEIDVFLDQDADGTLDEVLKGSTKIQNYQSKYEELVAAGLKKGELVKINGTILVKTK